MAGTTVNAVVTEQQTAPVRSACIETTASLNKAIDDLATLRAGAPQLHSFEVDPGAAGADITARAVFVAPVALTVQDSVKVVCTEATVGVDAGNALVLTLRNITAGEDIATATRTATNSAGDVVALTLAAANADLAANDVVGITVTQGATTDAARLTFQFETQRQTVDAAADLTANKVADLGGTVIA